VDRRGHRRRGAARRVDGEVGAERRAIGGIPARGAAFLCHDVKQPARITSRRRAAPSIRGPSCSTHSNSIFRSRGAFASGSFRSLAARPRTRGAERRETRGVCETPLACRAIGTPGRLRGVPRPLAIGDARLSAFHRGDFGRPGPRFRLRHYPPERVQRCSSRPGRSVRRAVPVPPGTAVANRSRGTPLPAPPSARLRKTPLDEPGCESF
jgi:hypothetical protein